MTLEWRAILLLLIQFVLLIFIFFHSICGCLTSSACWSCKSLLSTRRGCVLGGNSSLCSEGVEVISNGLSLWRRRMLCGGAPGMTSRTWHRATWTFWGWCLRVCPRSPSTSLGEFFVNWAWVRDFQRRRLSWFSILLSMLKFCASMQLRGLIARPFLLRAILTRACASDTRDGYVGRRDERKNRDWRRKLTLHALQ